jgi:type III restriction enzyme
MKGLRDEGDKAKAETTRAFWVAGVNALGGFGRWDFAEFRDWAQMEQDFAALVARLTLKVALPG